MAKVNVKDAPYYATGDGVTDDTAAIQQAIDDVNASGGGVVYIPAGKYYITSSLVVKDNVHIEGEGPDVTVIDLKDNNDMVGIKTPSATMTTLTPTSGISVGDVSNTINNNLQVGDFIVYTSNKRFTEEWDGGTPIRDYYVNGEMFKIRSATPTQLYFTDSASLDMPLANITKVDAFTPTRNVTISGLTVTRNGIPDSVNIAENIGILIQFCDKAVVRDVKTVNTNYAGIKVDRSMNVTLENVESIGFSETDGYLYGVLIADGAKHVYMKNIYSRHNRHGVSGGNSGIAVPMHVFADGIFIMETTQNPSGTDTHSLDTHGATLNFHYTNCYLDKGLSISGIGHTVENVVSVGGDFLLFEGGTDMTFRNIRFLHARGFYTDEQIHRIRFFDIDLNLYYYTRNSTATGSTNVHFENCRIVNAALKEATDNTTADSTVTNYGQGYIGLLLRDGFSAVNCHIEGFPEGLYVAGDGCHVDNVSLVNCGWLSNYSNYECALHINEKGSRSYIHDVRIGFTKTGLSTGSPMRLDYFGSGEARRIQISNVIHPRNHTVSYANGVYANSAFTEIFLTHCWLYATGAHQWSAQGKFIHNNFVANN